MQRQLKHKRFRSLIRINTLLLICQRHKQDEGSIVLMGNLYKDANIRPESIGT